MISLQSVEKQFGSKVIYNKVNASFHPGHRYGIVGPNGAGKTMLMRILVGQEQIDKGRVSFPSDLRFGFLAQEMTIEEQISPLSLVLLPFAHLFQTEAHCEALARTGQSDSPEYRKALAEFDRFQSSLHTHDIYTLTPRAKSFLAGLGVPAVAWERPMHELSGGFRMRVMLAQLLLLDPDMLLLDEPTNHLDIDSLIWLEKFLQRFRGGVLVVSHDRDFLDRVTDHTTEIFNGGLTQFKGPVNEFLIWKASVVETEERRLKGLQDQINKTESFIERFKAKSTKATQAKSKQKHLDRLLVQLPENIPQSPVAVHFTLRNSNASGSVPIKLTSVGVSYGEKRVFANVSLNVNRGDRIAILGPNGVGKSTLLKICASQLQPSMGTMELGHNAQVRYFSQHRLDQLDPEATLYDTIARAAGTAVRQEIQTILGSFMFSGEEAEKKVRVLSGGEKSRLSLATILANPGNVLLLDEPTNHLDIESIERLAEVLQKFSGTILIVSHDEYFVSRVASRIIEMRQGTLRDFPGTFSEFRAYLEEGLLSALEIDYGDKGSPLGDAIKTKEERNKLRDQKKRLERDVEKAEKALAGIEVEIKHAKSRLEDSSIQNDYVALQTISTEIRALEGRYELEMGAWESASEKLGAVVSGGES